MQSLLSEVKQQERYDSIMEELTKIAEKPPLKTRKKKRRWKGWRKKQEVQNW